MEQNRGRTTF